MDRNRKAQILAENETYLGDFNGWKRALEVTRTATPKDIQDVGKKWLTDGSYSLLVLPFGDYAPLAAGADRSKLPEPTGIVEAKFPTAQRATLSNGMKVLLVQRHDLPLVNMQMIIDTGYGADFASLTTYLRFPGAHHSRIRHSNFIERTFGETRRRVKVIGRLPGERTCLGLVWAVLDRASRGWRGVIMTPAAVRQLQALRRQLFEPPTIEEVTTDIDHTVTPAA